jgi:hypothetical protein
MRLVGRDHTSNPVFTIPSLDRSMLVLKSVLCLNHSIEAIIDTGSGVTVFSPQLCKLLQFPFSKMVRSPCATGRWKASSC